MGRNVFQMGRKIAGKWIVARSTRRIIRYLIRFLKSFLIKCNISIIGQKIRKKYCYLDILIVFWINQYNIHISTYFDLEIFWRSKKKHGHMRKALLLKCLVIILSCQFTLPFLPKFYSFILPSPPRRGRGAPTEKLRRYHMCKCFLKKEVE